MLVANIGFVSCHFSRSLRGNSSSNQDAHEGKECNGGWSWLRVHILRLLRSEKRRTVLHFTEVECQNQPYNEQVFLGSFGKILLLFPVYFDDALVFPVASPNIPDNFSPQKFSRKTGPQLVATGESLGPSHHECFPLGGWEP